MKKALKLFLAVLLIAAVSGCSSKSYGVVWNFDRDRYEVGDTVGLSIRVSGTKEKDVIRLTIHPSNSTAAVFEKEISAEETVVLGSLTNDDYTAEIHINGEKTSETYFKVEKKPYEELKITVEDKGDYKIVSFNVLPTQVEQLQHSLDFTDEYQVAATLIAVLAHYEIDPEQTLLMLDYIDGPNEIGNVDKSQMKEQFAQYPYVCRSYFEGTSVENNYSCDSYAVKVSENPYSRTEANYVTLRVQSSGADSSRGIGLRQKQSTGEWFADNYLGILAGIRKPAEADPWH